MELKDGSQSLAKRVELVEMFEQSVQEWTDQQARFLQPWIEEADKENRPGVWLSPTTEVQGSLAHVPFGTNSD